MKKPSILSLSQTAALALFSISLPNAVLASLPQVDFNRMGKVGLAGAFAGLDVFNNNSASLSFDPTTSTLFSRSSDGALSSLASTSKGGQILAGCALSDTYYFSGSFSSMGSTSASNVASYTPSSGSFNSLGSNGPDGEVLAIYCDNSGNKLWVGGRFSSPGASVAVWDPKASSWSSPPFGGLSGASAEVLSITTNSSASSLFFAGSFITSFQSNGTSSVSTANWTNNPNVPFSTGATPFSASLVPIPLQNATITASPSSTNPAFGNIENILCPSGADGPGHTWLAQNGSTALITVETYAALTASGVRLGNTFENDFGTTSFTVTSIPDNTLQTLHYTDPSTGQEQTCSTNCPLLTNASVPYQDFLFGNNTALTGVQIALNEWTGAGAGLHLLQLLSSGAFASAVDSENAPSCFAPGPSNTTRTGDWEEKHASTAIAGTIQDVLFADVNVGTTAAQAPSFTWMPYVSAAGTYDINILVPGCTNFEDCPLRTSVTITVFPGGGLQPWVTTVSQQNTADASTLVYSGPVFPTSPSLTTTVTMTLGDPPLGSGQGGKYELVAATMQLVLISVNATSATSTGPGSPGSSSGGGNAQSGFGFFEWPLSSTSNVNAANLLPNSTETTADAAGFALFSALGGNDSLASSSTTAIVAVAHHSSGAIFLGGNFSLSSSGAANIVAFKNGALSVLTNGGLNGPVTSLVLDSDVLYVGGSFTDTASGSSQGALRGIASYSVTQNSWSALDAGVNGGVTSLAFSNGQVQVTGNFTTLLTSTSDGVGLSAGGFAVWDVNGGSWVNSGGFLVGSMSFVGNGTAPSNGAGQTQFLAGNVDASLSFGASGFVMLQNGGSDGVPAVTPLGVQLDSTVDLDSPATSTKRRRSHVRRATASWVPSISFSRLLGRQSSSSLLPPLPPLASAPAPAVLAGTFWTNTTSSDEVVIIGGNFSFPSSSSSQSQAVAIYNSGSGTLTALQGDQINGTVRALFVQGNQLFVGGELTLQGTNVDGLAIYDLVQQQWDVSGLQPLQASSGSIVSVRSISASAAKSNTVIVAGSFAQAGSLPCQAVCSWDTSSQQWSALGDGIQGGVSSVDYAGDNQENLVASGSIAVGGSSSPSNVAMFSFSNLTWTAVGNGADIPGPVTAVVVNDGNASSIFAAGRSSDGSSSFLTFWNGGNWTSLGSTLQGATNVSQLLMVPLVDTHTGNDIIQSDRMLMISGSLSGSSFGNASSALFDGQNFIPYFVSASSSGSPGSFSALLNSFTSFSFNPQHFLAVGVVILISIAIAAGVVFLLVLIGILWTLFSRRDDGVANPAAFDDDDDSTHHRPSSLLAHINAATRTTILSGHSPFSDTKEEIAAAAAAGAEDDPFHDGDNYMRAETPSDAIHGMGVGEEEVSRPAHARYSFEGGGQGEIPLSAGQELEVLDDRDQNWWFVRDIRTGSEGVVPASYLY